MITLSPSFVLPDQVAVESQAILAKKGAGKSNAAVVMAEEMHANQIPFIVIDPKGDWYGLRSSSDGTKPGLAVPVFGGKHGDFPLDPAAGAALVDIILGDETRGYLACVIDVSQLTLTDQRRFLLDFGIRLFHQKDEERVLHLFLEEAHEYLPQQVQREQTKLVSTWQRIVKQGRFKGLGVTVISQRSAALNKDVLTQVDSLFVLRTLSPQDRKAVLAWIEVHVGASDVVKTLHGLAAGECWLWSPDRFAEPQRFQFRRRRTFDSGATPQVGQVRKPPATIADIDDDAIQELMAEAIEKAKATDPKMLNQRIRELERALVDARSQPAEPERVVQYLIPEEPIKQLVAVDEQIERVFAANEDVRSAVDAMEDAFNMLNDRRLAFQAALEAVPDSPLIQGPVTPVSHTSQRDPSRPARVERRDVTPRPKAAAPGDVDLPGLDKAARAIVVVLAQFPAGRTRDQLATLAAYHPRAKGFANSLSALRTAGILEGNAEVRLTAAGHELAASIDVPPVGNLVEHWKAQRKIDKAGRLVLDVLAERWPDPITRDDLAGAVGYHPRAKGFANSVSKLRALGVITRGVDIALSDEIGMTL